MKLGLVADIHEAVEPLRAALRRFREECVDQVVVLEDVFETGTRIEETCRLLAEAAAVGVYGNHDFGLSVEPAAELRARYSGTVLDFMTSLRPRLEIAGCHFTHVEPWLDPEKIEDLWYFEGPPDTPAKLQRIFAAAPQRLLLTGHMHQWLLATPAGLDPWQGEGPISVGRSQRCFLIIDALCAGSFAILDTAAGELFPQRAGQSILGMKPSARAAQSPDRRCW